VNDVVCTSQGYRMLVLLSECKLDWWKYWFYLYCHKTCDFTLTFQVYVFYMNLPLHAATVKSVYNGHLWEIARWPLYAGRQLNAEQPCRKCKATEDFGEVVRW